jgi:hypothetical protein
MSNSTSFLNLIQSFYNVIYIHIYIYIYKSLNDNKLFPNLIKNDVMHNKNIINMIKKGK